MGMKSSSFNLTRQNINTKPRQEEGGDGVCVWGEGGGGWFMSTLELMSD